MTFIGLPKADNTTSFVRHDQIAAVLPRWEGDILAGSTIVLIGGREIETEALPGSIAIDLDSVIALEAEA